MAWVVDHSIVERGATDVLSRLVCSCPVGRARRDMTGAYLPRPLPKPGRLHRLRLFRLEFLNGEPFGDAAELS
jgi:hypothetical protein